MIGHRLMYKDLVADNGLSSGSGANAEKVKVHLR